MQDCVENEEEKGGVKGVNSVAHPFVILLPPSHNPPPDNHWIITRWHRVS
jgi:hypothetical protein